MIKYGWLLLQKFKETGAKSDDSIYAPTKYYFGLYDDGLLKGFGCEQTMLEEPTVEFNLDLARRSK